MIDSSIAESFRFHFRAAEAYATRVRDTAHRDRALTAMRLAREDVATGRRRYTGASRDYWPAVSWQDTPGRGLAHVMDASAAGLRLVGKVESDGRDFTTRETGWYSDPFGDSYGLHWGVVYQMTGRNGQTILVPGYQCGDFDGGPTLDFASMVTLDRDSDGLQPADRYDARDAAGQADDMARRAADLEREYQTAWQAGARWAEAAEEMAADRRELLDLLRERRAARRAGGADQFPTMCAAITSQARALVASWSAARERRAALKAGQADDLGFWTGSPRLADAFNEGAGV